MPPRPSRLSTRYRPICRGSPGLRLFTVIPNRKNAVVWGAQRTEIPTRASVRGGSDQDRAVDQVDGDRGAGGQPYRVVAGDVGEDLHAAGTGSRTGGRAGSRTGRRAGSRTGTGVRGEPDAEPGGGAAERRGHDL